MAKPFTFHERVGRKIKEIREKCGITIPDLSDNSGLSVSALNSIESSRRDIKLSELFNISKALNVRISAFLNPCDSQIYKKRKEEDIENYISLKSLSPTLNISESRLRIYCKNNEIPYYKISGKHFFKASEINEWLKHHCGSKKKIKKEQKIRIRVFGVEPLISVKEAAEILDCSSTFIYRLGSEVPYYRIGGSIKYKLSDIEDYRDKKRIDIWEISTRIEKWKTSYVWPEPSTEERMVNQASFRRSYNERARPGYVVKEKTYRSTDFKDLKQTTEEFIKDHILAKSNLLECDYFIINRLNLYGCSLKWWGLPYGRENNKVHSTGLKSDSPDKLREKVEKLLERIPEDDLINVDYYTWGASYTDECHNARITYYLPKKN